MDQPSDENQSTPLPSHLDSKESDDFKLGIESHVDVEFWKGLLNSYENSDLLNNNFEEPPQSTSNPEKKDFETVSEEAKKEFDESSEIIKNKFKIYAKSMSSHEDLEENDESKPQKHVSLKHFHENETEEETTQKETTQKHTSPPKETKPKQSTKKSTKSQTPSGVFFRRGIPVQPPFYTGTPLKSTKQKISSQSPRKPLSSKRKSYGKETSMTPGEPEVIKVPKVSISEMLKIINENREREKRINAKSPRRAVLSPPQESDHTEYSQASEQPRDDDEKLRLRYLVERLSFEYHESRKRERKALEAAIILSSLLHKYQSYVNKLNQSESARELQILEMKEVIDELNGALQRANINNRHVVDTRETVEKLLELEMERIKDASSTTDHLLAVIRQQKNEIADQQKIIKSLSEMLNKQK